MPRHSPAKLQLIESMAQEQLSYETIAAEQNKVFRTDPARTEAAYLRLKTSPLVAKHGQNWIPPPEKVKEYLAACNEQCKIVPQDFDDRIKIHHAAMAALMCLSFCVMGPESESVQLAMVRRHEELKLAMRAFSRVSVPSNFSRADNRESPLSKLLVDLRPITAKELQSFRDPENLHGKQFVLSPNTEDAGMYEVIGYSRKRDRTLQFDVLFDDCDDPLIVEVSEMMNMLEDSLYLPS